MVMNDVTMMLANFWAMQEVFIKTPDKVPVIVWELWVQISRFASRHIKVSSADMLA